MVVDASVLVAYLLAEATADESSAILDGAHAPAIIDVEVTHALRGLVRSKQLALPRAEGAREDLSVLRLHRHPDGALLLRAWELRDVCSTYDALYVALAEALDASLMTRDRRLARGLTRADVRCPVVVT